MHLPDTVRARVFFGRAVDEARRESSIAVLAAALRMLAWAEAVAGQFALAATHASEGLLLAIDTGQENAACCLRSILTWAYGALGRERECRRCAEETFSVASARGIGFANSVALLGLGELELGLGRPADALVHYEALLGGGAADVELIAWRRLGSALDRWCRPVIPPMRA
jgi:hypothetical protein